MQTHDVPALLNAAQAAQLLGVSERRFHDSRRDPRFPQAVVLGARCVRWHRDELTQYAKSLPRVTLMPEPAHLTRREA